MISFTVNYFWYFCIYNYLTNVVIIFRVKAVLWYNDNRLVEKYKKNIILVYLYEHVKQMSLDMFFLSA